LQNTQLFRRLNGLTIAKKDEKRVATQILKHQIKALFNISYFSFLAHIEKTSNKK